MFKYEYFFFFANYNQKQNHKLTKAAKLSHLKNVCKFKIKL